MEAMEKLAAQMEQTLIKMNEAVAKANDILTENIVLKGRIEKMLSKEASAHQKNSFGATILTGMQATMQDHPKGEWVQKNFLLSLQLRIDGNQMRYQAVGLNEIHAEKAEPELKVVEDQPEGPSPA